MAQGFTMDGNKDLESVAEGVQETGVFSGSEDILLQVVATVVAMLLARLGDHGCDWEKQGLELVTACRGIYDAAVNDELL